MLRSIGAVAAGYLVFGASAALLFQLSGQAPHEAAPFAFKIASIIWGAVFALVAALIALGALISLLARPSDAIWSQVSALVVMAPCALIGGAISSRVPSEEL